MRILAGDGYASAEVRVTPILTEIIIFATRTREALSEKGQRIRKDTSVMQKRIGFPENSVTRFAEKGCEVMIVAPEGDTQVTMETAQQADGSKQNRHEQADQVEAQVRTGDGV